MYGAMRERAPNSSRIAGLGAALAMTLAVGAGLANGFIGHVARLVETPLIFIPIADDPKPLDQRLTDLPMPVDAPPRPPLGIPKDIFAADEPSTIWTAPVDTGGRPIAAPLGGGTRAAASPVRTRPTLITRDPPPYPAGDVRRQNEGVTGLRVCLDASGRVTSADLASSSGHPTLDTAALRWIRSARFAPAMTDGAAQPVCGHEVIYEWKIENAHERPG